MKLLLVPLLLVAGLAGSRLVSGAPEVSGPSTSCPADDCTLRVERTGPDTCRVTCSGPGGEVLCQRELVCGEGCETPCDEGATDHAKIATPCPQAGSCSR